MRTPLTTLRLTLRPTLFALLCIAGCDAAADSQPPPQSQRQPSVAPQDLPTKVREVRERMHARLAATRRIERAIAFGDLDAAHREARLVATLDEPDLLPAWRPYVDQIRSSARQIELAEGLVAAAKTSALLGRRCAQCHEATSARIVFPKVPAPSSSGSPPGGPKLPSHMASHQWATERLWEGLVGPSSDRWLEGARALAQAPLTIVAEGDLPPDLAVGNDVARIRLLATRAQTAKTQDDRAALYGDLLATCARCHAKIRDR
jgi:cytochrome c553